MTTDIVITITFIIVIIIIINIIIITTIMIIAIVVAIAAFIIILTIIIIIATTITISISVSLSFLKNHNRYFIVTLILYDKFSTKIHIMTLSSLHSHIIIPFFRTFKYCTYRVTLLRVAPSKLKILKKILKNLKK